MEEKIPTIQLIKIALWTAKESWHVSPLFFFLLFVNRIIQALMPILTALFASFVVNELFALISTGQTHFSDKLILFLLLAILTDAIERVTNSSDTYLYSRFNYRTDVEIRGRYLQRKADLDYQYFENEEFNSMMKRVDEAVWWRFIQCANRISSFVSTLLGMIVISGTFIWLNPLLFVAILLPVIVAILINKKFGSEVYNIWRSKGDDQKNASHSISAFDDKSILAEAKIYNFGNYLKSKYDRAILSFIASVTGKLNKKYIIELFATLIGSAIFLIIQIYIISQILEGKISVGNYTFYIQNIVTVSSFLWRFGDSIGVILENAQYVKDLKTFFEIKPKIELNENPVKIDNKAPVIEFRNVSFKYPSNDIEVLKNVSFKVNAGEKIALVGINGAGKTTIIKLLARFYDVNSGEILINGVNIKEIDLVSYYKLWGVLFQNFSRFWFTARENIGLGNVEDIENLDFVKNAAEKADASDFIEKLPNKYENMLSNDFKKGTDLSGGQWQKIGISRGVFADPKLIILDEPTSALDALSEAKVFEQIYEIAKDTTVIMVSHRFATVRKADKILVLEQGEIVEDGSHEELMDKKGLYEKMFSTQAEGYK